MVSGMLWHSCGIDPYPMVFVVHMLCDLQRCREESQADNEESVHRQRRAGSQTPGRLGKAATLTSPQPRTHTRKCITQHHCKCIGLHLQTQLHERHSRLCMHFVPGNETMCSIYIFCLWAVASM